MEKLLRDTFTACRYFKVSRELRPAAEALDMARQLIAEGNGAKYGASRPVNPYNREFEMRGNSHVRWIEDTTRAGLRPVGYADELSRRHGSRSVEHKGWFTDSTFQDEVFRGVVWQLPGRNGRALYVYGYEDPNNKGAALISFDPIEGDGTTYYSEMDCCQLEAARAADQFAERAAETEREFRDAWQLANEWQERGEEMQATRATARQLVKDMRTARRDGLTVATSICEALRAQLRALIEQWEAAHNRRSELDSEFYYWPGGGAPRQSIEEFVAVNL